MTEIITTFVTFSMPSHAVDEFKTEWLKDAGLIAKQAGQKGGNLYRRIDSIGRVEFINVAHWESADNLKRAREAALIEQAREGRNQASLFEKLGVLVSAENYLVEVSY